jgi:hypothetical protein
LQETTVIARSNNRPIPRRGLSREEGAMYVGVSPSKFDEMRRDGRIGPPRLIDGRKVFDIFELDQAFDALPIEDAEPDDGWKSAV